MSNPQTAMTFSMSEDVKQDIDRIAKREQRSKSAVFRDMYRSYKFGQALDNIQAAARSTAIKLGIETDDDVVDYVKSRGRFA
jgi:predicted transcriptional regulator